VKKMSKTFDVSDFNVKELNDAIDKTNFPCTTNSLTPAANGTTSNGTTSNGTKNGDNDKIEENVQDGAVAQTSAPLTSTVARANGFGKNRDLTPLKVKQYSGDVFEIPGSPRTPRSSTTPGRHPLVLLKKN
jgi:hypothetical protein